MQVSLLDLHRFMSRMLPTCIKRIRHDGVLESSCKAIEVNATKFTLQLPQPHVKAMESAQGFIARAAKMDVGPCPCCKVGRLQVRAILHRQAHLPSQIFSTLPPIRGSP